MLIAAPSEFRCDKSTTGFHFAPRLSFTDPSDTPFIGQIETHDLVRNRNAHAQMNHAQTTPR